jgi:coenzyme PQQ synthesis protein D (PqqD)
MNVQLKGRPARRPEVWIRQVKGENAAIEPGSRQVYLMNDTAKAIWDLCDGETSPGEMIEAICAITSLPPEVVTEDVERTLLEFEGAGLIAWVA